MTLERDSPRLPELRQVEPESELLQRVIDLADQHRKYLGILPPAAWADYASKGGVIAAVQVGRDGAETVIGLVSFRMGRQRASIAHLVVTEEARGLGLARQLVDEVSARTQDSPGILVRCRRDFEAHAVWPRLGFVPRGEQAGRGKDARTLTWWWRDHGHADLFTWDGATDSRTPVVIDANTFIDLYSKDSARRDISTALALEDILGDRIDILVTPELPRELNRHAEASERKRLINKATAMPQVSPPAKRIQEVSDSLTEAVGERRRSRQDQSDFDHVVFATAAGLEYLVTRDRAVHRRLAAAALEFGLNVVTPDELVSRLADDDPSVYWPAAAQGLALTVTTDPSDAAKLLVLLNASHVGEKQSDVRRILQAVLLAGSKGSALVIQDSNEAVLGGMALTELGGSLVVHALRVKHGALEDVVARHLVARLRNAVPASGGFKIECADPNMPPSLHAALLARGFVRNGAIYSAVGVGGLVPTSRLASTLAIGGDAVIVTAREIPAVGQASSHSCDAVQEPGAAENLLAAEVALSPVTLLDDHIPVWSVPIRPHFGYELLGAGSELFDRQDALGLSVEHVYYTGSQALPPPYSRVLWYVSGQRDAAFVGHSIVLESGRLPWRDAYRINRRLGVYTREEVRVAANSSGEVGFVRFGYTKLFGRPVSLHRAQRAVSDAGAKMMLRGPWCIPSDAAQVILEVGHDSRT